jgi:mitochondrial import receptor subunit TOM20
VKLCPPYFERLRANVSNTVPKPVLDILAEMIAADSSLNVGPFASEPASDTVTDRGLD